MAAKQMLWRVSCGQDFYTKGCGWVGYRVYREPQDKCPKCGGPCYRMSPKVSRS